MYFQLCITLTEMDYLAFNEFHTLESAQGKKLILKSRLIYLLVTAILMAVVFLMNGRSTFTTVYAVLLGLFTFVYMFLYKGILRGNVKRQIKNLKKTGKLPFETASTVEFYEDRVVEITPSRRIEESYDTLERICILQDRYILLYHSSVSAYILPVRQIREQTDPQALLNFLFAKCNTVEHY